MTGQSAPEGAATPIGLGPVVVTDRELAVLEEEHRRSLGEPGDGEAARAEGPAGEARALQEARLSLVARGLLGPDGALGEDDDLAVLVVTMLDVRLAADRVLVVERIQAGPVTTAEPLRGTRLVHVVDSGACVEDVLPDGSRHLYLLLDRAHAGTWVTAVTVPSGAAAGRGPVLVVDPDRPEQIPMILGRPSVLAELSVLPAASEACRSTHDRDSSPAHHLLALGPSGCWVTDVEAGRSLPERVAFRPVHPDWVQDWVSSVVEGPPADVAAGGGGQGTMTG